MKQKEINKIHQYFLDHFKIDFNLNNLWSEYALQNYQDNNSVESYINLLTDSGSESRLTYLRNSFSKIELNFFIQELNYPIIVFTTLDQESVLPHLVAYSDEKLCQYTYLNGVEKKEEITDVDKFINTLLKSIDVAPEQSKDKEELLVLTCYPYKSYFTDEEIKDKSTAIPYAPTPYQRLLKLFATEKKEISYIYLYAILASLVSLSLPLGVQAIIGIVSGGQITTSVMVLIGFIISGILLAGGIQLIQIYMVEHINQKLFVKTAFEFAFRIPKLKIESVINYYPPELMNRFFDIVTLQKGLAKILIEFSAAIIQIILGLLLLTFYHNSFIVFGVILILTLILILRLTASKGLKSSLMESKYKYQVANWLEEIARVLSTFKLAGYSSLPMEKTDYYTSQYLVYRKKHFNILLIQYVSFILFKTFITGGLLIMGCVLLIQKQLNIGQFVASEIVIILVMNAVEKFILQLDTFYDVLTSIEKIGFVMDLPIERPTGVNIDKISERKNYTLEVKGLKFKFPNEPNYILKNIDLTIGYGEHICLAGYSTSGKTTFVNILLGSISTYEGLYTVNGVSMRELNKNSVINHIGDNIAQEGLFDGTILENISLGRNGITLDDILWAVECVGLTEFIQSQESGLNTKFIGGNMGISESAALKIILARSIVKKPKLLILEDFLLGLEKEQKIAMLTLLLDKSHQWTMILISNDEEIMKLCDRTVIMKEGTIVWQGPFNTLSDNDHFEKLV